METTSYLKRRYPYGKYILRTPQWGVLHGEVSGVGSTIGEATYPTVTGDRASSVEGKTLGSQTGKLNSGKCIVCGVH